MVFRVININIRIRNLLGYIHGTVFVFSGLVRLRNKMEAYHNVDACCNDRTGLFCSIFNLRDGHDISYFDALAVIKSMTGLPYRHLQGMLTEMLGDEDSLCYTTIYKRFQALDVKRHDGVFAVTGGGTVPFILHIANMSL